MHERSAGWLERLRATLPSERLAGSSEDLLGRAAYRRSSLAVLNSRQSPFARIRLAGAASRLVGSSQPEKTAAPCQGPRKRRRFRRSGSSLFGLDSLVDFDWRIAIGDSDLTEAEFAELVARNERLVHFRGQWVPLDPALLAQIRKAMARVDNAAGLSFQDVLQLHLLGGSDSPDDGTPEQLQEDEERALLEVELNEHLIKLISQLGGQTEWPALAVPAGLQAELRAYQHDGFAWLTYLRRFGLGACLADDMGLGKTVQFITYLLHLKETNQDQAADTSSLHSLFARPRFWATGRRN